MVNKLFDSYSPLDVQVVHRATSYGCALIGGTAVQFLARQYGVKERRSRSVNDLDFITPASNPLTRYFNDWLVRSHFREIKAGASEYMWNYENPHAGVEVDVLISHDPLLPSQIIKVAEILVWHPVNLFVSKVQRMTTFNTRADTDKADLNTLYDILEQRNELPLLETALSNLDLSDAEIAQVNDWIKE